MNNNILSLYTYLFERDGIHYIYNSETEFLSSISEDIYEKLYDGAFDKLDKDILNELAKRKIIVDKKKKYDFYYLSKLRHLSNIGVTNTLTLIIAPTTACNFACPYCYEGEKKNHVISKKVIDNLINFINSYTSVDKIQITWYGGEPLVAFKKIKEIVQRINTECHAKIVSQSIVTNAYLLSEEVIQFMLNNKFNSIQISFDGVEKNHNKTRYLKNNGHATFSHIINNLDNLVMQMPNDFHISLRININRKNQEDFISMYKFMEKKYKKRVFTYPAFIREASKDANRMCYKSMLDYDRFNFYKLIESKGIPIDYFPHKEIGRGCMVSRNDSFIIGPFGEMYKCWNDFNHPEKIIGYIHEKKLKNPTLVSQYLYDTSIFNDLKCKECLLFPVCDGGCQWIRFKNLFDNKQYNLCVIQKDRFILEECLLQKSKTHHKSYIIKAL